VKKLDEKDFFARFAMFTALNRIGKANPAAWDVIVKALSDPKAEIREGAVFAMRETFDERLVRALTAYVGDTANPNDGRAAALKRSILRALAVSKAAVAGNFIGDVLRNAKKNEAMLPDAIIVAQQIGGGAMADAIAAVIGADVPADTLVAAIEAVGRMKHAKA